MSPLWGANGAANTSAPKWVAYTLGAGSGATNQAANNNALVSNTTPNAFVNTSATGTISVTTTKLANSSSGTAAKQSQSGWNLRRSFQGPILTLTANAGSNFANNETVLLSNGTVNAVANLTTNATGNLVSASIQTGQGGLFTNTGVVAATFRREKHLSTITTTGGSGYSNTDTILASNGVINGTATLTGSVNATGGFQNASIVLTNVGLWGNTQTNAQVTFTVLAANGAASNGTGATLVANLSTSTSGTVLAASLGGRGGRVTYECLVAMSKDFVDASSNTAP